MAEDEKKAVELDDDALEEVAGGESTPYNVWYCATCDAYTKFTNGICWDCGQEFKKVKPR